MDAFHSLGDDVTRKTQLEYLTFIGRRTLLGSHEVFTLASSFFSRSYGERVLLSSFHTLLMLITISLWPGSQRNPGLCRSTAAQRLRSATSQLGGPGSIMPFRTHTYQVRSLSFCACSWLVDRGTLFLLVYLVWYHVLSLYARPCLTTV